MKKKIKISANSAYHLIDTLADFQDWGDSLDECDWDGKVLRALMKKFPDQTEAVRNHRAQSAQDAHQRNLERVEAEKKGAE